MLLGFLQRAFGRERSSRRVAKERLRLVLIHDRTSVSSRVLENLKEDLIQVISNYMEIDSEGLEVNFSREGDSVALIANIPVLKMKRTSTG